MLNSSSLPSSEHGDARFERLGVDDDFLVDLLFRADEPLDFFDQVGRGDLDGVQNALGLFLDRPPARRLFLLPPARACRDAARGNPFCPRRLPASAVSGSALRRQAGGDVFGAFDFVRVAFFKHALGAALFAHHVGARLGGFAVGFLRVVAEAAFGAEPHAAAAPRKIVVTHKSVSFSMDVYVLHQAHGDQRAQH